MERSLCTGRSKVNQAVGSLWGLLVVRLLDFWVDVRMDRHNCIDCIAFGEVDIYKLNLTILSYAAGGRDFEVVG